MSKGPYMLQVCCRQILIQVLSLCIILKQGKETVCRYAKR